MLNKMKRKSNSNNKNDRKTFVLKYIGYEIQVFGQYKSRRIDSVVMNYRNQRLQCSLFEPIPLTHGIDGEYNTKYPCVIYCHCNTGSRLEALRILPSIIQKGMALFCFDFAGSGLSDGEYVTLGINESQDLECIIAHLQESGNISNIALWGRSMGAATCIMYVSKRISQRQVKAIVFDSGFSNLNFLALDIARQKTGMPSVIIEPALSLVSEQVRERVAVDIQSIDLAKSIHNIYVPCYFLCSREDTFVKCEHSEQLHARYNGQKWIEYIPGNHNANRSSELVEKISKWIADLIVDKFPANSSSDSYRKSISVPGGVLDLLPEDSHPGKSSFQTSVHNSSRSNAVKQSPSRDSFSFNETNQNIRKQSNFDRSPSPISYPKQDVVLNQQSSAPQQQNYQIILSNQQNQQSHSSMNKSPPHHPNSNDLYNPKYAPPHTHANQGLSHQTHLHQTHNAGSHLHQAQHPHSLQPQAQNYLTDQQQQQFLPQPYHSPQNQQQQQVNPPHVQVPHSQFSHNAPNAPHLHNHRGSKAYSPSDLKVGQEFVSSQSRIATEDTSSRNENNPEISSNNSNSNTQGRSLVNQQGYSFLSTMNEELASNGNNTSATNTKKELEESPRLNRHHQNSQSFSAQIPSSLNKNANSNSSSSTNIFQLPPKPHHQHYLHAHHQSSVNGSISQNEEWVDKRQPQSNINSYTCLQFPGESETEEPIVQKINQLAYHPLQIPKNNIDLFEETAGTPQFHRQKYSLVTKTKEIESNTQEQNMKEKVPSQTNLLGKADELESYQNSPSVSNRNNINNSVQRNHNTENQKKEVAQNTLNLNIPMQKIIKESPCNSKQPSCQNTPSQRQIRSSTCTGPVPSSIKINTVNDTEANSQNLSKPMYTESSAISRDCLPINQNVSPINKNIRNTNYLQNNVKNDTSSNFIEGNVINAQPEIFIHPTQIQRDKSTPPCIQEPSQKIQAQRPAYRLINQKQTQPQGQNQNFLFLDSRFFSSYNATNYPQISPSNRPIEKSLNHPSQLHDQNLNYQQQQSIHSKQPPNSFEKQQNSQNNQNQQQPQTTLQTGLISQLHYSRVRSQNSGIEFSAKGTTPNVQIQTNQAKDVPNTSKPPTYYVEKLESSAKNNPLVPIARTINLKTETPQLPDKANIQSRNVSIQQCNTSLDKKQNIPVVGITISSSFNREHLNKKLSEISNSSNNLNDIIRQNNTSAPLNPDSSINKNALQANYQTQQYYQYQSQQFNQPENFHGRTKNIANPQQISQQQQIPRSNSVFAHEISNQLTNFDTLQSSNAQPQIGHKKSSCDISALQL